MYHLLHAQLASFAAPYDVVVMVCTAEVALLPFDELARQLDSQLAEVGVLASES